ncbi:MAG: succinate dehydrogenase [Terriglobia bacterium]
MANQLVAVKSAPSASWGQTQRRDLWWVTPLLVFLGLGTFAAYATWAAFQGEFYRFGPYLSPFYSPELWGSAQAWIGGKPGWWPTWFVFSPAFFILWGPGGFRLSCYYYRGAYYKAFWADPPSCTVGEPRKGYRGERRFPLIWQNIHRYFFYVAIFFIADLFYDAYSGFQFNGHWGMGVWSLILLIDAVLLSLYTFGCHSFRHLIGGLFDRISGHPVRGRVYDCVSCLNSRHMMWAWISLSWVGFTDLYIRMCAMGVWRDWRFF